MRVTSSACLLLILFAFTTSVLQFLFLSGISCDSQGLPSMEMKVSFSDSFCTVVSLIVIAADNLAFDVPIGLLWYLGINFLFVLFMGG